MVVVQQLPFTVKTTFVKWTNQKLLSHSSMGDYKTQAHLFSFPMDTSDLGERLKSTSLGEFIEWLGGEGNNCQGISNEAQLKETVERVAAETVGWRVRLLSTKIDSQCSKHTGTCYRGAVLFRRIASSLDEVAEVRVAVIGNVDAGKSTLLGVLTRGQLDDGRGGARRDMFRHPHELETGRTSSVGQEMLGFDAAGKPVYGRESRRSNGGPSSILDWQGVCANSDKLITFLDMAGHERYLKTTMFGLTGCVPDYALLVIGANGGGLVGMAKEHLALASALAMPVIVALTKIDMAPEHVAKETIRQLKNILKSPGCRRVPLLCQSEGEVVEAITKLESARCCPIIPVSSVTGQGIQSLLLALELLTPPINRYAAAQVPAEFLITDHYTVTGVGTVVAGTMVAGSIRLGQTIWLGPDGNGAFIQTQVKGIQRKRVNVSQAIAGQGASFALKKVKRSVIRRGMVILGSTPLSPLSDNSDSSFSNSVVSNVAKACREFEAEVLVLFHSTTLAPRYQAMLHCGVIRQTVAIVSMANTQAIRTGDRALVRFRFTRSPEYLHLGARLIFREGRTKGVGKVTALLD